MVYLSLIFLGITIHKTNSEMITIHKYTKIKDKIKWIKNVFFKINLTSLYHVWYYN